MFARPMHARTALGVREHVPDIVMTTSIVVAASTCRILRPPSPHALAYAEVYDESYDERCDIYRCAGDGRSVSLQRRPALRGL